jgi:hypothetical protein
LANGLTDLRYTPSLPRKNVGRPSFGGAAGASGRESAVDLVRDCEDEDLSSSEAIDGCELNTSLFPEMPAIARTDQGRIMRDASDWQVVLDYFRNDGRFQLIKKVAPRSPAVKDRVNAVNAMVLNARNERRLFLDPRVKELIKDLEQVAWKADANMNITGELDKRDPKRTHASDALGYMINVECGLREQGGPRGTYLA